MLKRAAKNVLRSFGYEISKVQKVGVDPFWDMKHLIGKSERLAIFDVGANDGSTAKQFRKHFPHAEIHSFEPSPSTFRQLVELAASDSNMQMWNYALGATPGSQVLYENDRSFLSSFFRPGSFDAGGRIVKETAVDLETIDHFCDEHHIRRIDILKSDTEGYDLEVLKGAMRMLQSGAIRLVYFEVNFADKYVGQGSFGQQYDLLCSCGFRFVSFYEMFREAQVAAWTDALFVHSTVVGAPSRLNLLTP